MVFAPAFKICLHMSIQRTQNKVMLFKSLSLQVVHVNTEARITIFFQLKHILGSEQQSLDSPVTAAHGLGCVESLHRHWSNQVAIRGPHPLNVTVIEGWGLLCQWTACVGTTGSLWKEWSLCVRRVCYPSDLLQFPCSGERVPVSTPSTLYPSGRHIVGLILIVNSYWISVLVKEAV